MVRRTQRSSSRGVRLDPRLLIGVGLVAASTLGVWALVTSLDDAAEVYAVRETVTPGTRLEAADLIVERVRLGGSAERYLSPGAVPEGGLVVTRTLFAGELVPGSAVDDAELAGLATVVVPSRGTPPSGIAAGAIVDVWAAEERERGEYATPTVLVAGAEVAAVAEADSFSGGARSIELLIPREKVAAVLEALAAGDVVDLVAARPAGE